MSFRSFPIWRIAAVAAALLVVPLFGATAQAGGAPAVRAGHRHDHGR